VSCVDVPAIFHVTKASPQCPYVGLTLELQPAKSGNIKTPKRVHWKFDYLMTARYHIFTCPEPSWPHS